MTSYLGKIISRVYGEDKLAQKDAELAERDEEITRLMQLLSQRDAELAQKETEISFYDAELARKDNELDRKNADLDQKDTEIARLVQLLSQRDEELAQKNTELAQKNAELAQKNAELLQILSQRDEESAQNTIVLNDVKQELLSAKQELTQRDMELAQERICLRDRTLPAPIDIQVKLGEMFKSWEHAVNSGMTYLITPLLPKIRAATEQIKEPIMGLFHVTYSEIIAGIHYMYANAMLFTATDVYYLSNGVTTPEFGSPSNDIRQVIIEDTSNAYMLNPMWKSRYTFVDPVWVKLRAISEKANFKKIIQWNNQYSGYTGKDYSNPNGGNSVYVNSGSETAMHRRTILQYEYDGQFDYDR